MGDMRRKDEISSSCSDWSFSVLRIVYRIVLCCKQKRKGEHLGQQEATTKRQKKKKSVLASQFHSNSDQQRQNEAHNSRLMPFSKKFCCSSLYRTCIHMTKSSFLLPTVC